MEHANDVIGSRRRAGNRRGRCALAAGVIAGLHLALAASVPAQSFTSGSTGEDGSLVYLSGTNNFFPPAGLDADGDGVYHFTSVFIASGVTVKFRADRMPNRPVVWLSSGDVYIAGTLDLNGENGGSSSNPNNAVPGPGGFHGGMGRIGNAIEAAQAGQGPGGGMPSTADGAGAGGGGSSAAGKAGRKASVEGAATTGAGGVSYGSRLIVPLIGGSGGGGATGSPTGGGGSGGAGGGAILIASSTIVSLPSGGRIQADGGTGGSCYGGGGSGGSIRLVAPSLIFGGSLNANGGGGNSSCGSPAAGGDGSTGRIRIEGTVVGSLPSGSPPTVVSPTFGELFPTSLPQVRVTKVDGEALPTYPTAGGNPADVTIDAAGPVTLEIAATRIPLGTSIQLKLTAEDGTVVPGTSSPLAGTFEESTATATLTIPYGLSRFVVFATWAQ